MAKQRRLTKSRYMAGRQCLKRLWQQVHAPLEADDAPETSAGVEVERLARRLFPGGTAVQEGWVSAPESVVRSRVLIEAQEAPALFEATIAAGRMAARVDVLERLSRGRWGIREVRSATEVKDEHLDDVAFQLYVTREAGLAIGSVEIVHVDTDYVLGLRGLDPEGYFARVDVTKEARARARAIGGDIRLQLAAIDRRKAPAIEPWTQCGAPGGCEFWERCGEGYPEDWILRLPRLSAKRAEALRGCGVQSIGEIPDDMDLTSQQRIVRDAHRSGQLFVSPDLGASLRGFGPPALYLDFETMSPAIPLYPGTRPYERIPFQWSLHRLDRDGRLQHHGYLADGRTDPREEFVATLLAALGRSPKPILVYSSFERVTLGQLAKALPRYRRRLGELVPRLRDLEAVVRRHVYHPSFVGSSSIKAVAPTLAPRIRYDDLDHVSNGADAAVAFERIAAGRLADAAEEKALRAALTAYCRQDTLAMVEVHRRLGRLARRPRRRGLSPALRSSGPTAPAPPPRGRCRSSAGSAPGHRGPS